MGVNAFGFSRWLAIFTVMFLGTALPPRGVSGQAAGGAFDPTFSGDGYVGELCPSDPIPFTCNEPANAVAMQADGRFVLAGTTGTAFRLWRYTADGQRDSTFVNAPANFPSDGGANDVAIQSDGKIVAVGGLMNGTGFAIARYLPDGTLDATFGTGGSLIVPMGYGSAGATNIVIQPDGKLLIGGVAAWLPNATSQFALARLLADGRVDTTFGSNGRVYTRFVGNAEASDLALDSAGRIILSGLVQATGTIPPAFAVVRYLPDGVIDATFGVGGRAIARSSHIIFGRALVVQNDDRIVVGGTVGTSGNISTWSFGLIRWTADGVLDPSFGSGGVVVTTFPSGYSELNALALQSDGKLVAGGLVEVTTSSTFDRMAFARYLADGALDPAFGSSGLVTSNTGRGWVNDLVIQPDAKIVAAGVQITPAGLPGYGGGPMPAMARLLP